VPNRGRTNEPAFTRFVAHELAAVRGMPLGEIERATTANFFRLFNRVSAPSLAA
jgi:TatD DNase family protein